jgi:hypothetical protein
MAHSSQDWLAFAPAIMRRKCRASNNSGFAGAGCRRCQRLERFFVECAREFHYRKGFH